MPKQKIFGLLGLLIPIIFNASCGRNIAKESQPQEFDAVKFKPVPSFTNRFSFCPKTKDLHYLNATWASAISHLVEVSDHDALYWYNKYGFEKIRRFNIASTGTQADWLENEDLVILVFRGSDEIRDWLTDFNILSRTLPGIGRFHKGFANAFTSLWPSLEPLVYEAKNKPMWVMGHSLGGALAQIYTAYHVALASTHAELLPILQGFYSFAAPAPLSQETKTILIDYLERNSIPHYQFFNPFDPTPKVVPNYKNLGIPIVFEENKKVILPNRAHDITLYFNTLAHLALQKVQEPCDSTVYQSVDTLD